MNLNLTLLDRAINMLFKLGEQIQATNSWLKVVEYILVCLYFVKNCVGATCEGCDPVALTISASGTGIKTQQQGGGAGTIMPWIGHRRSKEELQALKVVNQMSPKRRRQLWT